PPARRWRRPLAWPISSSITCEELRPTPEGLPLSCARLARGLGGTAPPGHEFVDGARTRVGRHLGEPAAVAGGRRARRIRPNIDHRRAIGREGGVEGVAELTRSLDAQPHTSERLGHARIAG